MKKIEKKYRYLLMAWLGIIFLSLVILLTKMCSIKVAGALMIFMGIISVAQYLTDESVCIQKRSTLLCLIGIITIASLPCLGKFTFMGHDLDYHLGRISGLAEEITNFQFPVRIHSSMANNHGYVSSLFYGDIFLYVPAILHCIGVPLYLSYNIYVILFNAITAVISYVCFKKIFNSKKIGLFGSLLYSLSAYRLVDIYLRSAVGEYSALAFLPLVILGLWHFTKDNQKIGFKEYFPLVIGLSGIFESHILSCEMVAIFCVLFFCLNVKQFIKKERLIAIAKIVLWTIGLNCFFLIPFLSSYTMDLKVKSVDIPNVQVYSLYLSQIFSFFIPYGIESTDVSATKTAVSIGGLFAICICVFVFFVMNRKKWELSGIPAYIYGKKCLFYSFIAIVFSSIYFPWGKTGVMGETIKRFFCQIQFPWRYLGIATILLVLLTLCIVKILINKEKKRYAIIFSFIMIGLNLLSVNYYYTQCHIYGSTWGGSTYSEINKGELKGSTYNEINRVALGAGEYLLNGTDISKISDDIDVVSYGENVDIISYRFEKGIRYLECKNNSVISTSVLIPVYAYDNYVAYDENKGQKFEIVKGEDNKIKIDVPGRYDGVITIKYQEPVSWRIAEIISCIAFVLACVFTIRCLKKK